MFNDDGTPHQLPYGEALPVQTEVCLAGATIPAESIYGPRESYRIRWGDGLAITPGYEPLASLMTQSPRTYRFVVTTGERDRLATIQAALSRTFHETGIRFGIDDAGATFLISRLDESDQARAASQGIKTIFTVVGWGVLGLGALGLLVSQLVVVRDRMWLFGLGMAIGARRIHIAVLVCVEVILAVTLGVITAVLTSIAAQPITNSIAQATFGMDADLLNTAVLPGLAAGCLATLVIASAWPAYRASTPTTPLTCWNPRTVEFSGDRLRSFSCGG